jgi:hypothetical protein
VNERPRIVGHNAAAMAPQGPAHPLVLGSRGPVGEPEQAAVDAEPVATVDVVLLRLVAEELKPRTASRRVVTLDA